MTDSSQKIARYDLLQQSLQAILGQEELFTKIIDFFPYPLEVYDRAGTTVMVNRAMLREFGVTDRNLVVGRYNIFVDPAIEETGLAQAVKEVFGGRSLFVPEIKVPVQSILQSYQVEDFEIDAMYQDANGFPIFDQGGQVSYVVVMLITRRIYKGKVSIARAVEYLDHNWAQQYDLKQVAGVAGLSPYHFSRLFKGELGLTPYQYYLKQKIEHVMEKLLDSALTVGEAFEACGWLYSGYTAGIFKEQVGLRPSEYRQRAAQK